MHIPMADMSEGMTSGMMIHLSIFKNSWPMYPTYIASLQSKIHRFNRVKFGATYISSLQPKDVCMRGLLCKAQPTHIASLQLKGLLCQMQPTHIALQLKGLTLPNTANTHSFFETKRVNSAKCSRHSKLLCN